MARTSTSWGAVAEWYEGHLGEDDTYHAKVIAPHIARITGAHEGVQILEIGCGEGYFSRILATHGAQVIASDISPELIQKARAQGGGVRYEVAPADRLSFAGSDSADVVLAVLTLQNMERIEPVMKEVARVLKPTGKLIGVINHPAFRIPKRSSWGWDDALKMQFRRLDGYLSASRIAIDMTPGKSGKHTLTYSFHRSLQDYVKALGGAGFGITRIEEWTSHKVSEKGPRAVAEDNARKEFPLFLMFEAKKLS